MKLSAAPAELQSPSSQDRGGQEAELDALTNLLMQNMESTKEEDYFGKSCFEILVKFVSLKVVQPVLRSLVTYCYLPSSFHGM